MREMDDIDISMEIFENGIAGIELGIEDFKRSEQDPRRLHSAVRNLYAGTLLLLKSKLAELSKNENYALIQKEIKPVKRNGSISWIGSGKKTIDVHQMQERFKSMEIPVDWNVLINLQTYRNNIEHYFNHDNIKNEVVKSYIIATMKMLCDFMKKNLFDPQQSFSAETWAFFLAEQSIFQQELHDQTENFNQLNWLHSKIKDAFKTFHCPECGCQIVTVYAVPQNRDATGTQFQCRQCATNFEYQDILHSIINDFSCKEFFSIKNGGDEEIACCPECGEEKYIVSEQTCFACGVEGPFVCDFCENEVPPSELVIYSETGRCGWCDHQFEKIMEDD